MEKLLAVFLCAVITIGCGSPDEPNTNGNFTVDDPESLEVILRWSERDYRTYSEARWQKQVEVNRTFDKSIKELQTTTVGSRNHEQPQDHGMQNSSSSTITSAGIGTIVERRQPLLTEPKARVSVPETRASASNVPTTLILTGPTTVIQQPSPLNTPSYDKHTDPAVFWVAQRSWKRKTSRRLNSVEDQLESLRSSYEQFKSKVEEAIRQLQESPATTTTVEGGKYEQETEK